MSFSDFGCLLLEFGPIVGYVAFIAINEKQNSMRLFLRNE